MTKDDKFLTMPSEELCDWAVALMHRAEHENAPGGPHHSAAYRMLLHLIARLRKVERRGLNTAQINLMNKADQHSRRGEAAACFKLRMEAEAIGKANNN